MTDYAIGLPMKGYVGDPTTGLTPGQLVQWVLQRHDTESRPGRPHQDLRLGTGTTGLYSWAIPKAQLPEAGGEPRLAKQVEVHRPSYANFTGRIGKGYGAGTVTMDDRGEALITKTTPSTISFTLAHAKIPTRYSLIKTKGRDWILINRTIQKGPETIDVKPKYRLLQADDLDEALAKAKEVQEKIDGAHFLYEVTPKGPVEAYSVRSRVTGEPVVHTERMGLSGVTAPDLVNTQLRGEAYGVDTKGTAIPFTEISGILNSNLAKALKTQQQRKIKMQNALFDITKYRGKDVTGLPIEERMKLLEDVTKALPAKQFHMPARATDLPGKMKLLADIVGKRNKRTSEGIVLHMPGGEIAKYVIRPQRTGYLLGTYPGTGKREGTAGGLTFALEPGGPEMGRVGTGFTDAQLRDIVSQLPEHLGKPIRLEYKEQFPSGKLRAPSYKGFETDVTKAATVHKAIKEPTFTLKFAQTLEQSINRNFKWMPNIDLQFSEAKKHPGVTGRGPTTGTFTNAARALAEQNMPPKGLRWAVGDKINQEQANARAFYAQLSRAAKARVDADAAATLKKMPDVTPLKSVARKVTAPYAAAAFNAYLGKPDDPANPVAAAKVVNKAVMPAPKEIPPTQLVKSFAAKLAQALPSLTIGPGKPVNQPRPTLNIGPDVHGWLQNIGNKFKGMWDQAQTGIKNVQQNAATAKGLYSDATNTLRNVGAANMPASSNPVKAISHFTSRTTQPAGGTNGLPAELQQMFKSQSCKEGTVLLKVLAKSGECRHKIAAEVADTPELMRQGLMHRSHLSGDSGMLFTKAGSYWMRNVRMPLDILFLDKEGTVIDVQTMGTVKEAGLKLYTCRAPEPCSAIELPAGCAAEHGIVPGDYVVVPRLC